MAPLVYHAGQIAIQEEARTRIVADRLAHWVGPVEEFSLGADLILLATADAEAVLRFTVLSGAPPLIDVAGPAMLRLPLAPAAVPGLRTAHPCGGLAINLGQARRARINGVLTADGDGCLLAARETFTLCRKYMAPSLALGEALHVGPVGREPLALDDPWLCAVVEGAETSFLSSVSPDGGPDVAHRGGPAGFLRWEPAAGRLTWPEYLGYGNFKSACNERATGRLTLLLVDLRSGDAIELVGRGEYTNVRTDRRDRLDPLVRHADPYPVQGTMTCVIEAATRLRGLMQPRSRIERAARITSRSTVAEQAPR